MEKVEKIVDLDLWAAEGYKPELPETIVKVKAPKWGSRYLGGRVLFVTRARVWVWDRGLKACEW